MLSQCFSQAELRDAWHGASPMCRSDGRRHRPHHTRVAWGVHWDTAGSRYSLKFVMKSAWAYDEAVFFYVVSGVSSLLFVTKVVSDELLRSCFFLKTCVYLLARFMMSFWALNLH